MMILHSSFAILPSSLPIKKRWGLRKFHIACCFQQLQTHWMIASHSMRLGEEKSTNLEQLDYLQDLNRLLFSNVIDQAAQKTEKYLAYYIGAGINKLAASAKSLAYISLLQHLDAFCNWCPQTCLWWIQWYKWDQRGFSQEPYELYGTSSLDFLCNSSSPFFFFPPK